MARKVEGMVLRTVMISVKLDQRIAQVAARRKITKVAVIRRALEVACDSAEIAPRSKVSGGSDVRD